ncbi:hypothetical protein JOB18_029374 [Solea senegalensis]|uniref:Uncharacterized protein n=1 Tax=Solea senegalensis TaxID=28829 RepID=A0AAV6RIN2_SOLSE|nr:hypothetical protein JOB18_029374 [Solea senegalensis]
MDLTDYGTHRLPDCAPLSSFLEVRTKEKRGDRKKGPGSECRDGPPTSPPLVGVVWTQTGGLVLLRFQSFKSSGQEILENERIHMEILRRNRKLELELTELEVE